MPKKVVSIDTKSGSLAYNRLDMQISQTIHMAIELYPNLDYLLVLDHYDDITLFNNDVSPQYVSYYQMKTSDESISIETAISEKWLSKLYEHLYNTEWIIQELGLITNTSLKITVKQKDSNEKIHTETKKYSSEKTKFSEFNEEVINKIKTDIAKHKSISQDEVDLSKFVHMRTTISIEKHREIIEQEMGNFLQKEYPRITLETAKTIYSTLMDLLSHRQSYELLDKSATFSQVRANKGISKNDFTRIIDEAMFIDIPEFNEIRKWADFNNEEVPKAALEYTNILADCQNKSESFRTLFLKVRELCASNSKSESEKILAYCERIYNLILNKNPIYNQMYISIIVISTLINEWRHIR